MKLKVIFLISLFLLLSSCCAYSNQDLDWSFYGDGRSEKISNLGPRSNQTSLWLSCDWGGNATSFYTWKKLTPGIYKISGFLKARDVQEGAEGVSFWHFYDSGKGIITIFDNLHGSYDWRKFEYSVEVTSSNLTIWYRLKSPGQVWISGIELQKISTPVHGLSIDPPRDLKPSEYRETVVHQPPERKLVLSELFGNITLDAYYNIDLKKIPQADWSGYERIELKVFNPSREFVTFFLSLADDKSLDYWSQLNHKRTLAPGWNYLNFSLMQMIGERGSHRFKRSINLSKLKKVFMIIDSDKKNILDKNKFIIEKITLQTIPMPKIPPGLLAFDFTSQKANGNSNLRRVTSQTLYNDYRGHGFINPRFWRIEDSQYASELLRYSIGILSGKFRVKIPNGRYQISLIIEKLGYWDVPFWTERMIYANGVPIYKEMRVKGEDFLDDLLRFETISPGNSDHPHDLYANKIFHSIDRVIDVKNGFLELDFSGDATAISLNSLLVWGVDQHSIGQAYKSLLHQRNKLEFDWMAQSIHHHDDFLTPKDISIGVIELDLLLNPSTPRKNASIGLNFFGGSGESPYQVVQLVTPFRRDEKISWRVSDLVGSNGKKIDSNAIVISELVYQYTSPDINHETYLLSAKFHKELKERSLVLKKRENKYLFAQVTIDPSLFPGDYRGELIFDHMSGQIKLPIFIHVLNYSLPVVDFPVGFFGLDPLPFSYFPNSGYGALRKKYRLMALEKITNAGFTTFSGLPEDIDEVKDLISKAWRLGIRSIFTYGGQFPQSVIDLSKKPSDQSEEKFYIEKAQILKEVMSEKDMPQIIHTFSDEASGYSHRVEEDLKLAQKLKKYFPFMSLGGFGSFGEENLKGLNSFFQYGFYSSIRKNDISFLVKKKLSWGIYNASAGNLDDPRFTFGVGLYVARKSGLSHYLEWHASAFNNFPYYDFDGRESDSVIFYPSRSGKLYPTLRFEFARQGLSAFRKLMLLEKLIATYSTTQSALTAKVWLAEVQNQYSFFSNPKFLSTKIKNFSDFEARLNFHLKSILSN